MVTHIGLLTSGGDSPGMNACIRAAVRAAVFNKVRISGIIRGFQGLIDNDITELDSRSVSNIIQRGGTILKSARSKEFMTHDGRLKARRHMSERGLDALLVIGGDGSFRGAQIFSEEFGTPVVGIPGTIDNDLAGTDFTLGFDTAVNTAVEAIDKIRDTAASHDRIFFVELMGRDAGYISLHSGIASGAEHILMPEEPTDIQGLVASIDLARQSGKSSSIVIVCEGDDAGGAISIAEKFRQLRPGYETRVTILGHVQRGGSPTANDRILGTRLGIAAVEALIKNEKAVMAGIINGSVLFTPFRSCVKENKPLSSEMLNLINITSI